MNGSPMSRAQDDAPQPNPDATEQELTIAAVKESLAAFERGEGRPARDALEELRAKYCIPRDV